MCTCDSGVTCHPCVRCVDALFCLRHDDALSLGLKAQTIHLHMVTLDGASIGQRRRGLRHSLPVAPNNPFDLTISSPGMLPFLLTSSALQACKCLLSSRWLACPLLVVSLVVSALACANAGEYDIDGIMCSVHVTVPLNRTDPEY